jgi:hypothetical protein
MYLSVFLPFSPHFIRYTMIMNNIYIGEYDSGVTVPIFFHFCRGEGVIEPWGSPESRFFVDFSVRRTDSVRRTESSTFGNDTEVQDGSVQSRHRPLLGFTKVWNVQSETLSENPTPSTTSTRTSSSSRSDTSSCPDLYHHGISPLKTKWCLCHLIFSE